MPIDTAPYCPTCMPHEHDACSLTPGCPCCDSTMKQIEELR